jgi:hypothetical protein
MKNYWVYMGRVKHAHQDERGRTWIEDLGPASEFPGMRGFYHSKES